MINVNNMPSLPAYTTTYIVSMGNAYKENDLYNCRFIRQDNLFLQTGAIKLLPLNMSKFNVNRDVVLNGKKYEIGEEVNPDDFEFHVLKTLIKSNIIISELKDEFKNMESDEIIKLSKVYSLKGKTFKEISTELNIPFETIKEKFNLKQGGHKKKITLEQLKEIIEI